MSKHAQSKQNSTISISARLLILILLANVLSSCVTVIQTQTPIVPISEFTPTVQNPATQELTLVSPTEVATKMPKATETKSPTPTKTEAPEAYPIDLEKLVTPPKSFEELQQHPEKFVQAPNPMENFEEFKKWYNETLFEKALGGDLDKLPVNYKVTEIGIGDRIMTFNETEKEVLSVPKFFYFKDQNQFYLSYVVTLDFNGNRQSYTVVMRESSFEFWGGAGNIVDIFKGKKDLKML